MCALRFFFLLTSETDAGDTSAGERQNWVYSHRSRCVTGHKTRCTRHLKHGEEDGFSTV